MREIDLHPHALQKMGERELSADEVIEAIQDPDDVVPGRLGRKIAYKKRGEYWLRVIFEDDPRRVLVITAYVTRRR